MTGHSYSYRIMVAALMIVLMNCALMYSTPVQSVVNNDGAGSNKEAHNEVETVFELVTEEWLDIENCVPEQNTEDGQTDYSKVKTFDWYRYTSTPEEQPVYVVITSLVFKHKQSAITSFKLSPSTPPPDVSACSILPLKSFAYR